MSELTGRNDRELELTVLACCFAYPECLDEPWAAMPTEVFYSERCREVWDEILKQYSAFGAFDFATVVAAFRVRGDTHIALDVLNPVVQIFGGTYHPTSAYASLYAQQLKELYIVREKGKAALKFQDAIAKGQDQNEARLELDAVLTVLDSAIQNFDERSDEELAALIGSGARYETGFGDFDRLTGGMAKPGLNILAARPSVGKSALARAIIRNVAARGGRVLWYSQDQSENQILELEIARYLRSDTKQVQTMPPAEVAKAIRQVRERVWHDRVTLIDTPIRLDSLLTLVKTSTPSLVVIDYLQILDTGHSDEYESVTAASKALKTLAFTLRIPILALAQFNRGFERSKAPSLTNLRGSGQIEQDADQVWALDRDTTLSTLQEQEATWYVLKNKVGATGSVTVHWRGRYASYENAVVGGAFGHD